MGTQRQREAGADHVGLLARVDLGELDVEALPAAIERAAAHLRAAIDSANGPLIRAALLDQGAQRPALLLIASHRAAADPRSWRILVEDLQLVYRQLLAAAPAQLPAAPGSFIQWATRLAEADGPAGQPPAVTAPPLPLDTPRERGGASEGYATVTGWLDSDTTEALLGKALEAYRTSVAEILLAALAQSATGWTGGTSALVDVVHSLREPGEHDRTVGCFSACTPAQIDLEGAGDLGAVIQATKEQWRAALRAAAPPASPALRLCYQAQNDLPALPDDVFALLEAPAPAPAEPDYPLMVDVRVDTGRLRINWIYQPALHRQPTIERLAQSYQDALRALIAHCRSPQAGGYSPSDFPMAQLNAQNLQRLFDQIEFEEE